jgi:DNA sulfur modification protein DndB
MTATTLLPAIRSRVGDWNYYVTTLSFDDVYKLIKAPDEVHERKQLADWIQREAIEPHKEAIATYILTTPQRFLGSLIIGVYGGNPNWSPLNVNVPKDAEFSAEQLQSLEGRLGLLTLTGGERLFAIDGQHRVAGIKRALDQSPDDTTLRTDSVSAIFVAHDPTSSDGRERTRRLFTTVNKKAKVIAKAATIALDEDNGFAIVTRRLIDTHKLFEDAGKRVLYGSTGALPAGEVNALTSVVGLAEIVKDLYGGKLAFDQKRPPEEALEGHLKLCISYFDALLARIPEYKEVFVSGTGQPGDYRTDAKNHLLFRPAGQRAFARATQLLIGRKHSVDSAVDTLAAADLNLLSPAWHHILWNPVAKTMITGTTLIAEAQLLTLAKQPLRNKSSGKKLQVLMDSIAAGGASPP